MNEIKVKDKLAPPARERFELLKQAIQDGLAACFVVGSAIREIKECKYYEADGYKTFEDFCDGEYGWTKRYCNQLIMDAKAINSLPESLRKFITSHKAAQELAKIPESLRGPVIEMLADSKKEASAKEIKKSAPPPRKVKSGTSGSQKVSPPPRKKSSPTPPRSKEVKPKGPLDSTGLEVPVESLDLWNKQSEEGGPNDVIMYTSAMLVKVRKAEAEKNILFTEVDFNATVSHLSMALEDLKRSKPYAVCPTCQGKLPAGCLMCKERGFVSKFTWDHIVPAEVRKLREIKK